MCTLEHLFYAKLLEHSWHTSTLPGSLRQLALGGVLMISLVDRQIVLSLTESVLDAWSFFDCLPEFLKPGPNVFIVAAFAFLRNTQTFLIVVKNPEAHLLQDQFVGIHVYFWNKPHPPPMAQQRNQ